MKCSVELPVGYLAYSDRLDYDFVIASTCLLNKEYYDFYKNKPKRFMILDNGAFENGGQPLDNEVYYDVATTLKPDLLIVPDVLRDQSETAKKMSNFLTFWKTREIEGVALMGVLQGQTPSLLKSLHFYYKGAGIKYFGLPYVGGIDRYQFLKSNPEITNVHILGAPYLGEVLALQALPVCLSIDSSLPVKYTVEGRDMGMSHTPPTAQVTYETTGINQFLLDRNISTFSKACQGDLRIF